MPEDDGSAAPAAHLDRYRKLRTQAQALAAKATRTRSEPYLVLASSWIALAEELERLTRTSRKR